MLEGAACVNWVFKADNPEVRAVRWYTFVYNESLKVSDEDEQSKEGTTNIYDVKREAQRLKEQGHSFKGRWTVNELGKSQTAENLIELLNEGQEAQSAYPFYQHASAFTHWSPAAFPVNQEKQLAEKRSAISGALIL